MKPALCSLPARWVDPAENARSMQIQTNVAAHGAPRLRRIWWHYHKAASRAAKRNVLTVHWQGKCHLVNHVLCAIKLETHAQKRQPHCILRGFAREVLIFDGLGKWRGGTVAHILP